MLLTSKTARTNLDRAVDVLLCAKSPSRGGGRIRKY